MRHKPSKGAKLRHEPPDVFAVIRGRIALSLQQEGLRVRPASQLELAIGTFAPSSILEDLVVSDYPFPGSRYVSVRDGHVYIVVGPTDDGTEVLAYRLGFLHSIFSIKGGAAVGVTPDGWMDSVMVMYSMSHARWGVSNGVIEDVDANHLVRRSYFLKKVRAFGAHFRRSFGTGEKNG
jgi:hypothetical protein